MAGGRKGRTPREEDGPGWRLPSVPKLWAEVGGPAAAPGSWPRAQHQDESRVSSWGATPPPWGTFLSTRAPRVPAHAGVEMGAHAYVPVVIDQTASLSVSVTCVPTEKTGRPQAGRFRQKQGSEPVFRLCSPGAGTRPRSPVTYWCASEPGGRAGGEVWAPAFPPSGRPCVLALGVPGGAGRGAGGVGGGRVGFIPGSRWALEGGEVPWAGHFSRPPPVSTGSRGVRRGTPGSLFLLPRAAGGHAVSPQTRSWSPTRTPRPSFCRARASRWTWTRTAWTTASTSTSSTSATSCGACGASPAPAGGPRRRSAPRYPAAEAGAPWAWGWCCWGRGRRAGEACPSPVTSRWVAGR